MNSKKNAIGFGDQTRSGENHITLLDGLIGRRGPLKIVSAAGGSDENWNWSSFQLANSTPPLNVTGSAIAPSARMPQSTEMEGRPHTTPHDRVGLGVIHMN